MELEVFFRYLDCCFFKHKSMEKPKELKWNIEDEEVYIDYHTSYIGDHFYNQVLSKRTASFTDQKKVEEEKT